MNKEQLAVLRKIIFAVETGGQVYGKCRYDDFTPAFVNTSIETSVTIGAGQWLGNEARDLLQKIRNVGGEGFTEELDRYLDLDWSTLQIGTETVLAKTIIKVMTTPKGKACQDAFMEDMLSKYCAEAQSLGVTDAKAQGMCANFRHHGGYSAMKRVIGKTEKPYTLHNLYAACKTDTGNQVGAYRTRQAFVYNALIDHMPDSGSAAGYKEARENASAWMVDLANDNSHGYDQRYRWGEKGDYDCSAAVIQSYQQAGVPVKDRGATYTGNMKRVFLQCGFKDVTSQVNLSTGSGLLQGDVLLNEANHTAMYIGDGKEAEASINEFGGITGGQPGDQTGKEILIRSYRNYPWDCVLRYFGNEEGPEKSPDEGKKIIIETVRPGDKTKSAKLMQLILRGRGYKDQRGNALKKSGVADDATVYALRCYQTKHRLDADGICGAETWKSLTGL